MSVDSKKFFWGVSTSAHQVEGGNTNDWTGWEARTAKKNQDRASRKKWPEFILENYPNPLQEENYISGLATDHYNRFQEDFGLAKEIGANAFRFSIEWSRIEPEEGKFDEKEIAHYQEVIHALRERGIEPFVTLWHWTLPLWLSKKGGWDSRRTVWYFERFSKKIAEEFQTDVRYWIILNEPGLWSADAYLFGIKPPGYRNLYLTARVYFNLLRGHRAAYRALKEIDTKFFVGTSESGEWLEPTVAPRPIRHFFHYLRNYFFLSRIKNHLDFIGLNYYRRSGLMASVGGVHSDMGWEVDPEGIYYRLRGLWLRFHLPIFVTENGIADARDEERGKYIKEHVENVGRARKEDIDVRGYFHWSLLDNFEWQDGFWPRFGLVEVNYKTQERKMRKSAEVYRDIIKRGLP